MAEPQRLTINSNSNHPTFPSGDGKQEPVIPRSLDNLNQPGNQKYTVNYGGFTIIFAAIEWEGESRISRTLEKFTDFNATDGY